MSEQTNTLSPEQQQMCLEITRKLRQSPAASVFNEPVDPKKQNVPNYFKKIRNPQDLGTIYQRLQAGEYSSVTQWERDINTVWSNAETYNGKDSVVGSLSQHMSWHFQHLKKPLDTHSIAGWTKHIYNLREKFDALLVQSPPSLQSIVPRSLDDVTPFFAKFNSREIGCFMKASEMVNTPADIERIAEILKKNDPPINTEEENLIIDVNKLSPVLLHEIRAYYRNRLLEQGIPYPTEPILDES